MRLRLSAGMLALTATFLAACSSGTPTTPQPPGPGTGGSAGGGGSSRLVPFKLDGTQGDDEGLGTTTDASGNVYVVGKFSVATDFDPSGNSLVKTPVGGSDAFVAKYNADGTLAFVTVIGSSANDQATAVAVDPTGNVYATGSVSASPTCNGLAISTPSTPINAGGLDAFVLSVSSTGTCQWLATAGGSGDDEADAIAVDASGNLAVSGQFNSVGIFDPSRQATPLTSVGGVDAFVASYTSAGAYRWAFQIGSVSNDAGKSIAVDATGNVFVLAAITGTVDADPSGNRFDVTGPGNRDLFVARYNSLGQFSGGGWAFAVGTTSDDISAGALALYNSSVVVTADYQGANSGNFSSSGSTVTFPSAGQNDVAVLRYSQTDGSYVSSYHFGGTGVDIPYALTVDATGNSYIAGTYQTSVNFNPNGGSNVKNAVGTTDGFVVAAPVNGTPTWLVTFGSASNVTTPLGVAVGASASTWVTGYFAGTVDFDPSGTTVPLTATGPRAAFVSQYDQNGAILTR